MRELDEPKRLFHLPTGDRDLFLRRRNTLWRRNAHWRDVQRQQERSPFVTHNRGRVGGGHAGERRLHFVRPLLGDGDLIAPARIGGRRAACPAGQLRHDDGSRQRVATRVGQHAEDGRLPGEGAGRSDEARHESLGVRRVDGRIARRGSAECGGIPWRRRPVRRDCFLQCRSACFGGGHVAALDGDPGAQCEAPEARSRLRCIGQLRLRGGVVAVEDVERGQELVRQRRGAVGDLHAGLVQPRSVGVSRISGGEGQPGLSDEQDAGPRRGIGVVAVRQTGDEVERVLVLRLEGEGLGRRFQRFTDSSACHGNPRQAEVCVVTRAVGGRIRGGVELLFGEAQQRAIVSPFAGHTQEELSEVVADVGSGTAQIGSGGVGLGLAEGFLVRAARRVVVAGIRRDIAGVEEDAVERDGRTSGRRRHVAQQIELAQCLVGAAGGVERVGEEQVCVGERRHLAHGRSRIRERRIDVASGQRRAAAKVARQRVRGQRRAAAMRASSENRVVVRRLRGGGSRVEKDEDEGREWHG